MGGVFGGTTAVVLSFFQSFAEDVVAAGAAVLNNILNAIAGPAAHDKVISEFSTQNTYFYTDDAYIDALHNTDKIVLNSLIKGTSLTDEVIDFYQKAYSSSDFHLQNALDIVNGSRSTGGGGSAEMYQTFAPLYPYIECNYALDHATDPDDLDEALPSATLRINNTNLYEGSAPAAEYDSTGARFTWHTVLDEDGTYTEYAPTMTSTAFGKIQTNTKDYLKYLGAPDPETLLDDLPYTTAVGGGSSATYRDVIDSVFVNFRVKWISGLGSTTGNRVSNKYLYLLAKTIYDLNDSPPTTLTYTTDENDNDVLTLFKYEMWGDGQNYSMGLSHIATSTGNSTPTSSNPYQYNKELVSSDGYYYYDADKTVPTGDYSAQTQSNVYSYLNNSSVGTTEVQANWLEIEQNSVTFTIDGVDSKFPDEIDLTRTYYPYSGPLANTAGPSITLTLFSHVEPAVQAHHVWTQAAINANWPYATTVGAQTTGNLGDTPNSYYTAVAYVPAYDVYVDASDQVLRVGNLYIKKNTTEIMFATVPDSVYSNASVTYGRSNATSVTYYKVFNVSAIERVTDYAGETNGANTTFRYISHKLDASNACVSAPIIMGILNQLDPLEQHKLILASANLSMHLAYYLQIEKTWEEKLRAATLEVIRIGAIVFALSSLGSGAPLAVLAEAAIVAYATSIAVNAFIEHILVPVIISNFGEDEALILLAIAAVAIAYYTSKSSTAGLNQFPNQVTLFTTSIDIMNQMYSLAVVQPGLIEMQKEQEEWTETDNELTEEEEAFQEEYDALFGTENSPSYLLNLQIRAALNPMPASAYVGYHDSILERQFDCFDYDKYNTLNVS